MTRSTIHSLHSSRRLSIYLAACLAVWSSFSNGQEKAPEVDAEPPGWWAEEMGGESKAIWDRLRADGRISADEAIQAGYRLATRNQADVPQATARLLDTLADDPIPALREMLRHTEQARRIFAVTVAGELGDIRLEPEVARMVEDKGKLSEPLMEWYGDETVEEVARDAFDSLLAGGLYRGDPDRKLSRPAWFALRPKASPTLKETVKKAGNAFDDAVERAEISYRRDLAEAVSSAMEVEVFLLDFEMEKVDSDYLFWQTRQPKDRFPIVPYGNTCKILQRKRLNADEVKLLMPALKSTIAVEENTFGAMCHFPVHGIRVSNGEEVIFQTSICYKCMNFYVEFPSGGASWTGLSVPEFPEVMAQLMPIPASEIERFENMIKKKSEPAKK